MSPLARHILTATGIDPIDPPDEPDAIAGDYAVAVAAIIALIVIWLLNGGAA